jgi:hypothetical protein
MLELWQRNWVVVKTHGFVRWPMGFIRWSSGVRLFKAEILVLANIGRIPTPLLCRGRRS